MMNENEKNELTELEKARIQGRVEAFSLMSSLTDAEMKKYLQEFEDIGKNTPGGPGVGGMMMQVILRIFQTKIESAMKVAGDTLAVEVVTEVSTEGISGYSCRVNAAKFRATIRNFVCKSFTADERR